MRALWLPLLLVLLAAAASADAPEPRFEAVREGLLSPGRGAREGAEALAKDLARTDPAGVASLWDALDLRGRCLLVRALGAAGTRHAAEVAFGRAATAEPELFRALLEGLVAGGEPSLFVELPEGVSAARKQAIEELRLRWKLESELVRLKSPSGPTGHYNGQFAKVKALGPDVVPILLDITADRARPLPGESAAGPYASIHPDMVRFDPEELRSITAYGFSEVVEKTDIATIRALLNLYLGYVQGTEDEDFDPTPEVKSIVSRYEREELAPSIAFSLFDIGVQEPALHHVARLRNGAQLEDLWELGYACIRIGLYKEGQEVYAEAVKRSPSKALAAYNLACNYSMRAERELRDREEFRALALDWLELAIFEHNYGDWKWMEEDGDLSFIRGDPKYQELLRYLQKKYPDRKKGTVPKTRGPR
ncbi:MAG: TPR end-of-group domain-containing protein [Planctomycetota bacterium]